MVAVVISYAEMIRHIPVLPLRKMKYHEILNQPPKGPRK